MTATFFNFLVGNFILGIFSVFDILMKAFLHPDINNSVDKLRRYIDSSYTLK